MTSSLRSCIGLLNESVQFLEESTTVLHSTTKDIPRIRRVLRTRQVFGLVPESDLTNAKQSFKLEINPKVKLIVLKIETELARQRKQKVKLQNKFNLQHVRLQGGTTKKESKLQTLLNQAEDNPKVQKLKFLRNKRDRLKYSLTQLNLHQRRVNANESVFGATLGTSEGKSEGSIFGSSLRNTPNLAPP